MRYKKGDKVRVKSLDWYKDNKNPENAIIFEGFNIFDESMSEFCGKVVTIEHCNTKHNYYDIEEDGKVNYWTDEMFEGLAIEEPQEKMVSLEKVVKYLQSKLEYSPDIDGLQIYDTGIEEFVNDFCKAMEE
jgi:hypothetical protein